jgi:hypothetical protein
MAELIHDLQNIAKAPLQPKVMYAGDVFNNQPYIITTKDEINIVGDGTNAIHLDPSFGILLSGKQISLSAMPDQISIGGGFWTLNPLLISCVPSTTPTPVPVLIPATPQLLANASAISNVRQYLIDNSDIAD